MGIGNYFMNTNVDLFHDSTNNSNGILTSESNEMDLNTLIPVVDNNNHKVVDARLLHAFLQIRRDFTSWIKDRISKYGFIENQDFVLIKYDYLGNLLNDRLPHFGESDTQVVAKTDYLLLMDMAKELCMVENNDKGKKARRYFIEFDPCVSKIFYSHIIDLFNLRASDKARVSISFFLIISLYLLIFIFIIFIISSFVLITPTSYSNQHILYP